MQVIETKFVEPDFSRCGFRKPGRAKSGQEDSFDDPGLWLGPRVMPVAVDERLREVAAFHFLVDTPHNFVVLSNEYYLDEVHEDPADERPGWWTTLENWLVTMVECRGRFDPH